MASINFATREINCKIVYYGPGLSGKTTNLQVIHQKLPQDKRSDMVSLATEQDRTLFFDFLPLDLGSIKGFKTKFQLYTVPGQVYYNSTRKLVLRGVDGVVFVADSQKNRMAENLESLQNLVQNLKEYGFDLEQIPYVLQYNKRDMPDIFSVEDLNRRLNPGGAEFFEAISHVGKGVVPTLKCVSKKVIDKFNKRQSAHVTDSNPNNSSLNSNKSTSALQSSRGSIKMPESQSEDKIHFDDLRSPSKPPLSNVESKSTVSELSFNPSLQDLDLDPPLGAVSRGLTHKGSSSASHLGSPLSEPIPSANLSAQPSETENDFDEEVELRPYIPKSKNKGNNE